MRADSSGDGSGLVGDDCFGEDGVDTTRASIDDALECEPADCTGLVTAGLSLLKDGGMTVGGVRAVLLDGFGMGDRGRCEKE